MTEPVETVNVVTASIGYAGRHLGELLDAAADGSVVRILDMRQGEVRAYLTASVKEKPAVLDAMPDDLALIQARIRRDQAGRLDKALSAMRRKRAAS